MNLSNKTYVINAPKRPDRKKLFEDEAKKAKLDYEFTTDWLENKNGEDITPLWLKENNIEIYKNWNMSDDIDYSNEESHTPWWKREMTQGEIGCAISHWAVWKNCDDLDYITVLEDDALFNSDMKLREYNMVDKLNTMDIEWDLLYLGRVPQDCALEKEGPLPNLMIPKFTYCTYGYTLSRRGVQKLREYGFHKGKIIPSDELLTSTFFPHHREDIRKIISPTMRAFSFKNLLITQRSFNEVGSDTGLPEGKTKA